MSQVIDYFAANKKGVTLKTKWKVINWTGPAKYKLERVKLLANRHDKAKSLLPFERRWLRFWREASCYQGCLGSLKQNSEMIYKFKVQTSLTTSWHWAHCYLCLHTLIMIRHWNWIKSHYLSLHSTFHSLLFEVQEFVCSWFISDLLPPSTAILNYFPSVIIRWTVKGARAVKKEKWRTCTHSVLLRISWVELLFLSRILNIMVRADFVKKAAICGAAVSVIGAAFFHHRIQGEQRWTPAVLCSF